MVRRAEYALGKAIRKGQASGTVRERGEKAAFYDRHVGEVVPLDNSKSSPQEFGCR